MIKRSILALAFMALGTVAQAAGTVPGFNLTPQFDKSGKVMPGCKLYVYQAGTVATPQNAYQDSDLTILQTNPIVCDASGRLPQWFVADGLIKLRLTDKNGLEAFAGDSLLVIGPSSGGGGGGGSVDPTTIAATGDVKAMYGTGTITGWVRMNGRTIGSATSGASERANSDVLALFTYLWTTDANLTVSGGRGASAAADWAANKTITLPDLRGRALAGIDDMGNSDASRLTNSALTTCRLSLGCAAGTSTQTLITANLPPYTPAGSVSVSSTPINVLQGSPTTQLQSGGTGAQFYGITPGTQSTSAIVSTGSLTGTAQGGTSMPFSIMQPTMLTTFYIKL
ncbi:hypothetical protein [Bradyrhizobium oligotrophicum]|uniref:hypothetical protein n=1 Tax=Bradyrhizobium oligotrophicum TaxID=44255 RepID=UPI003EB8AA2B